MTNEEKAKEIAQENKMTYLEMENDGSVYDVDSFDEYEQSAIEMAQWKDEQLPNNAIIISGTIYSFDHSVTEGNPCDICDLYESCSPTYGEPLCAIFGPDADNVCFKKKENNNECNLG